jgi:hypothetical protein
MSSRRFLQVLVLFACASLCGAVLAACGSSDSSKDEGEITDAIVKSGTTDDATNCTELETQRFVEQNQFEKGTAAIDECKKPDEHNADSIDVSNIEVDGDKATADAAVTGATFDGQTLQISLVKEDGRWKLDHLDSFKDFDKGKFVDAFTANLGQNVGFTPQQATCITGALSALDDSALETLVLSGDQNQLVPVLGPCLK